MKKVFVNGCFDVIHRGHIELFCEAKSLGNKLLVAIDSDKRVSDLKGPTRPINKQEDRKFILESIKYIDDVVIFDSEDNLIKIIKQYEPDIMMVGSDYKDKKVIGSSHANKLVFFERIDGYSTTKVLQNISSSSHI